MILKLAAWALDGMKPAKGGQGLKFVEPRLEDILGRRCLRVEAHLGQDTGGGLTKWFEPADTVFIRFYTRFDPGCDYVHHFVTLRANKSLRGGDKWSGFGGAGLKPAGTERFSTAIEPWGNWGRWTPPGRWNFYSYWHEMSASGDGKYWGNSFGDPSAKEEAERRRAELGWRVREDPAGRGWRRLVPSPRPQRVIQRGMIREGARCGHIVAACGGGGIPIIRYPGDRFVGIEAVIDKDLTSSVLASYIGAALLVILTAVPKVYLNFGTPEQRPLGAVTLDELEELHAQGHFPPGSMGPKIEAVIRFLRSGGRRAVITDPQSLPLAIEGRAGTHFVGSI